MSYKAAFFDIDWTLYDHKNKTWDYPSLEAIKKLKDKGIACFLCSARPLDSMIDFGTFELGIEWRGYVGSAGAVAVLDGKTVKEFVMKDEDAKAFYEMILDLGLSAEIVYPTECFYFGNDTEYSESYYRVFNQIKKNLPQNPPLFSKVTGFNLFAGPEQVKLFQERFPHIHIRPYSEFGSDVMPVVREKSDGIKAIIDALGIKEEETLAFGDGEQDIPMHRSAHFVAMGNASDHVKEFAHEVTGNVWDSGILQFLRANGLAD